MMSKSGRARYLQNHVTIQPLTRIGANNVLYPFTVIGAEPQDKKFAGEPSTCEIGDNNQIREHVTIHRGTANGGSVTRVGSDNLIMVAVHVAHDCIIGDHVVIANQVMLAGHVHVEDGAAIGGGAGIHHFARIGTCAFVGGMARISKDVPPFMIVEGNPAEVRAINSIAMTRRGYESAHIDAVKHAYKRLYRENGAPMADRIVELEESYGDVPAVLQLCQALRQAADGVHGRAAENARSDDKRAALETIGTTGGAAK